MGWHNLYKGGIIKMESKGLEALKDLSKMVFIYGGVEQYKTIEKELKRLEELEKAFDSLSKENEKIMKELSKEIEKNRAFEIVKKYHITQAFFIFNTTYKSYEVNMSFYEDEEIMSEEEYNLVKEVLVK